MRKKLSSDQGKRLKFEAAGRELAKILRSLDQFIQTMVGKNNFFKQNVLLTYFWRFLRSNVLHYIIIIIIRQIIGV